jgi:hypothetical protein
MEREGGIYNNKIKGFAEKDVLYPWTFCIYGRFVGWTFCRLDDLYPWTFCIYGRFVERMFCREGRYVEGRFVDGRFVEGRFVEGHFVVVPFRRIFPPLLSAPSQLQIANPNFVLICLREYL